MHNNYPPSCQNERPCELEADLLRFPALPLLSIVQFLFMTGPFTRVAEIIKEIPSPIETGYTTYQHPGEILLKHNQSLQLLELIKNEKEPDFIVVNPDKTPLDQITAITAMVQQQILSDELEEINSRLCTPCGCTLCCIGPSAKMDQRFFEIPLTNDEIKLFPVPDYDNETGRQHSAMAETPLLIDGKPFYERKTPALFHWQNGWSLIMPTDTKCPNLQEQTGRCQVYPERPEVCRRPQIFPYILEPLNFPGAKPVYRLRQTLLAILDCPYVNTLKEEIAAYAAACELEVIFKHNKA